MNKNFSSVIIWGTGDAARKALTYVEVSFLTPVRFITSGVEVDGSITPFGLTYVPKEGLKAIQGSALVICSSSYVEIVKEILDRDLFDPSSLYIYGDHELGVTKSSVSSMNVTGLNDCSNSAQAWDIPAKSGVSMSPLQKLKKVPVPGPLKAAGKSLVTNSKRNTQNIHLFFPYFSTDNATRQREIDECLLRNLENPLFDTVTVIADGPLPDGLIGEYENAIVISSKGRLSFGKWLQLVVERNYQGILLLCNADIYFDQSISKLNELLTREANEPSAIAISRYDVLNSHAVLHASPHFSQDAWALHSKDISKVRIEPLEELYLGTKRCDSKLAFWLADFGLSLINPCHFIHAFHLHQTGLRTYRNEFNYDNLGVNLYVYPIDSFESRSWLEYVYYQRAPYYVARSRVVNWY